MMTSRTLAATACMLTATFTVSSCASSSGPKETATSAVAPTASPTPNPSASAASSGTEIPSNWKVVAIDGVAQLQTPPDWKVTSTAKSSNTLTAPDGKAGFSPGGGNFLIDPVAAVGGTMAARVKSEGDAYQQSLANTGYNNIKRLPDVTINGAILYHIRYEDGTMAWMDNYGSVDESGTRAITIAWSFEKDTIDRKGADALIATVMQTYRLL